MGSCFSRVNKNKLLADEEVSHDNAKRPTSPSQVTMADKTHEREKAYKNEVKSLEKQLKDLGTQRQEQVLKHENERKALDKTISKQREQIRELKEENETLLTRLSAIASAKLTDGNPNIADLSDVNRPTKLAEQYSELYDNEWTDAFGVINGGQTEEDACRILLDMFYVIYRACIKKADEDRDTVTDAIKHFLNGQQPPVELLKQLKDQRKKNTAVHKSIIKQEIKEKIKRTLPEKELRKDQHVKRFLNKSIGLCWRMAVQDPPVVVDVNIDRSDELHDSTLYKPYTKSGIYIDYIVWPVLYLHENGNILFKGIAQCKGKSSKNSRVHSLITTRRRKGHDNHYNKNNEMFYQSETSAPSTTEPDVKSVIEKHDEECIDNEGNQILDDEKSNSIKSKRKSLSGKVKQMFTNLEKTSSNVKPYQDNRTEVSHLPSETSNLVESKEHTDDVETLISTRTMQDGKITNNNILTKDDPTSDEKITKEQMVKNDTMNNLNQVVC
ncbi:uncharacterized protein LOC132725705 [Ruditapes philippinarum]|uniref:uncharacterized protein LOC132725705 n=1 Tax=Ruditapes philippinarum TaxID=129788 RepID=UPI00295B2D71|nr:uncharacterized protein LOC132725705 [Ruditapes philippinarum]